MKKAEPGDIIGRWREIVSDPLNLLIRRVEDAGAVEGGFVRLHNGHQVPFSGAHSYYGEFSGILAINRGVHEPLEEFVFQQMLTQLTGAPTMLELGAYWAHYSMWMLQARPNGFAYLVEPDPEGLEAGKRNFQRHGYTGVFEQGNVGRDAITVDDFMVRHGIGHLNVLHADIQGFEVEMLEGAATSLHERRIDYALISTHKEGLHRNVVGRLKDAGYRIDVNSNYLTHTTSLDGFVLAVRPDLPRFMPNHKILGREDICAGTPDEIATYVWRLSRKLAQQESGTALPASQTDAI